jgi:hypothetical protein
VDGNRLVVPIMLRSIGSRTDISAWFMWPYIPNGLHIIECGTCHVMFRIPTAIALKIL